jgi:hypothetical protein
MAKQGRGTCPTCRKLRVLKWHEPEWKTQGPTEFCSPECAVIQPRLLLDFIDNRAAPGA